MRKQSLFIAPARRHSSRLPRVPRERGVALASRQPDWDAACQTGLIAARRTGRQIMSHTLATSPSTCSNSRCTSPSESSMITISLPPLERSRCTGRLVRGRLSHMQCTSDIGNARLCSHIHHYTCLAKFPEPRAVITAIHCRGTKVLAAADCPPYRSSRIKGEDVSPSTNRLTGSGCLRSFVRHRNCSPPTHLKMAAGRQSPFQRTSPPPFHFLCFPSQFNFDFQLFFFPPPCERKLWRSRGSASPGWSPARNAYRHQPGSPPSGDSPVLPCRYKDIP
jgi:hypothetical protein